MQLQPPTQGQIQILHPCGSSCPTTSPTAWSETVKSLSTIRWEGLRRPLRGEGSTLILTMGACLRGLATVTTVPRPPRPAASQPSPTGAGALSIALGLARNRVPSVAAQSARSNPLLRAAAGARGLLLRQCFDPDTGTYTYLLADPANAEGVLIDPVFSQHGRDRASARPWPPRS